MFLGRQSAEWERTAQLMAMHINMNRPRGKKPLDPTTLNPYAPGRRLKPQKLKGAQMMYALRMLCPNATVNGKSAEES